MARSKQESSSVYAQLPQREPQQVGDNENPLLNALPSAQVEPTPQILAAQAELDRLLAAQASLAGDYTAALENVDAQRVGELRIQAEALPVQIAAARIRLIEAQQEATQQRLAALRTVTVYRDALEELLVQEQEIREQRERVDQAHFAHSDRIASLVRQSAELKAESSRLRQQFTARMDNRPGLAVTAR